MAVTAEQYDDLANFLNEINTAMNRVVKLSAAVSKAYRMADPEDPLNASAVYEDLIEAIKPALTEAKRAWNKVMEIT